LLDLWHAFTEVVGKVVETVASGINSIYDFIAEKINWVIDKINWLIDKINKIPGVEIDKIDRMETTEEKAAQQANENASNDFVT
jgi:phage-related protein